MAFFWVFFIIYLTLSNGPIALLCKNTMEIRSVLNNNLLHFKQLKLTGLSKTWYHEIMGKVEKSMVKED